MYIFVETICIFFIRSSRSQRSHGIPVPEKVFTTLHCFSLATYRTYLFLLAAAVNLEQITSQVWQNGEKVTHAGLWKRDPMLLMLIIGIGTLINIIAPNMVTRMPLFKSLKHNRVRYVGRILTKYVCSIYQSLYLSRDASLYIWELCCRTEKNACAWSQDKLKELLLNMEIEGDGGE